MNAGRGSLPGTFRHCPAAGFDFRFKGKVVKAVASTRELDAFKLRPFVTEVAGPVVRLSQGQTAGVGLDGTFWAFKAANPESGGQPENVGFVRVREVASSSALAQPIALARPLETGDTLLHVPMLGISSHLRMYVTPLSLLGPQPRLIAAAASADIELAPPRRPVQVQVMVSLPLQLDLGPISGTPWLSETSFFLEPAVGLRLPALDFIGLGGVRRAFHFGALALTPGIKTGVTFSTTDLGTVVEDVEVPATDEREAFALRKSSTLSMQQLGYSVGPELGLTYHFHPNLSAGLFVDFVYTLPLASARLQARPAASDPDETAPSLLAQDFDRAPVQSLRLGTGAQMTLSF